MKRIIFLLLVIQFFAGRAVAQTGQVNGVVSDSTGSPIVGATVVEKGLPSNGTSTNASGRFTLTLKGGSRTVVISNVGYEPLEHNVGASTNVEVVLKNSASNNMTDVVVVGYGRQKKLTLTGAVSSVSGVEIRENPSASVQNTLAGRLPGFFSQQASGRPGADGAEFFIRGQSSYNTGSNTPLIIVDDIEFNYDQFARLDPNEIETLSILKDASTTAVYGVRGANGVVIVTTRRGKISAPQIAFRGETSLQQPTIFPKFLNAYETALLYNEARVNDKQTPFFTAADLAAYRDHTDPYGHPDVDWRKEIFKKFSKQSRGNFDISGGTENVKYFISAGYLYQDGMVKSFGSKVGVNNNFYNQRYNYRSNLDIKVTRTTDLQLDLSGNISEINRPQVNSPNGYNDLFYDYSSFMTLAPFAYPIYNPDGSFGYSQWQKSPPVGGTSYDANNVIGRLTYLGYNRNFENNMNLAGRLNQKLDFITKGLSLKGVLSYTLNHTNPTISMQGGDFPSFIYDPATTLYTPRNTNIYRVRRLVRGTGFGSTDRILNVQASANYDRTFVNKHHVYGVALLMQQTRIQGSGNSVYNFIPNNVRGVIGRVGYDYKQKYIVEFNGAYNGSDRFAKENRYGFFPSGSVAWNISEESFFKDNIQFIDRLKLRGSYGLLGNDKIGNNFSYYYQPEYTTAGGVVFFGNPNPNSGTAIREGRLGNPNVSWEKEKKLNVGAEMGFLNNKLSATFDYFNNDRYDIMTDRGSANASVTSAFGQSLPAVNLGKVNNQGYEVELNYAYSINKELSFNVRGTYSHTKNKIVYQDEPAYKYAYQSFTGQSIGMQRVYTFVGFYKDSADVANSPLRSGARPGDLKYADLNKDNVIDGFDMAVQGKPTFPNTTAGLQLGVRFKGFNVGVFFQGAKDFYVRGGAEAIQAFSSNSLEIHKQAWTPALGDNAKYPLLTFIPGSSDARSNPSTFWFMPGDYIRLKTAEIGYSLPQSLMSHLKMKSIKIYANGLNLFTWTKLSKLYQLDPEITAGTDRVNYPPQRIFNFGISANF